MTNPNGKAMSPKEAAEQLRKAIKNSHHADTHVFGWGEDNGKMSGADDNLKRDLAALATLEALAESEAGLRAENERLGKAVLELGLQAAENLSHAEKAEAWQRGEPPTDDDSTKTLPVIEEP